MPRNADQDQFRAASPGDLDRLISERYQKNDYGRYLKSVLAEF